MHTPEMSIVGTQPEQLVTPQDTVQAHTALQEMCIPDHDMLYMKIRTRQVGHT